jgi:uncharacterized protein YbjQ (UPF0145 family)
MLIATTDFIPGYEIKEVIGITRGATIRARHIGRDILSGLKNIVGGELKSYTELLNAAREEALQRMIEEAKKVNADAVINVRFATSNITQGASEVLAYGTAVKIIKK